MYLTPELRAAVYQIPPQFLQSAQGYPATGASDAGDAGDGDAEAPADKADGAKASDSGGNDDDSDDNNDDDKSEDDRKSKATKSSGADPASSDSPAVHVSYDLDSFFAMGFEPEMIARVSSLYPNDYNACLEVRSLLFVSFPFFFWKKKEFLLKHLPLKCLLGGGIPEQAAEDDELPPLISAVDFEDVGGQAVSSGKRRRVVGDSDAPSSLSTQLQSAVKSRALVPVDTASSKTTVPSEKSAPKRSTAADVLFQLQNVICLRFFCVNIILIFLISFKTKQNKTNKTALHNIAADEYAGDFDSFAD